MIWVGVHDAIERGGRIGADRIMDPFKIRLPQDLQIRSVRGDEKHIPIS